MQPITVPDSWSRVRPLCTQMSPGGKVGFQTTFLRDMGQRNPGCVVQETVFPSQVESECGENQTESKTKDQASQSEASLPVGRGEQRRFLKKELGPNRGRRHCLLKTCFH